MESLLIGSTYILIVSIMLVILLLALGLFIVWSNNKIKKQSITEKRRRPTKKPSDSSDPEKCKNCKNCQCQNGK